MLRVGAVIAAVLMAVAVGAQQSASTSQVSTNGASLNAVDAEQIRARLDEILSNPSRGRMVGQVAVSPDGKQLAWVEGGRSGMEIRLAAIGELGKSERVTAATDTDVRCSEGQMAWSPDSRALAFFSDCALPEARQSELYVWDVDKGAARQVASLHGYAHGPAFSPDGASIAFLYVAGATRPAGALAAMKPWAGVIGEDGLEVQRVAMVPAHGDQAAEPAWATPANLHVYEFDWSPDAKSLAYIAAEPPGENNWWVAKLYTQVVAAESGTEDEACLDAAHGGCNAPRAILAPADVAGPLHGLQIAVPRWRPDGKQIAFIGGLMSDQGSTGGDVWVVSASGGMPHNLTASRQATPSWIVWDGNDHLLADEIAGGDSRLVRFALGEKNGSISARQEKVVFKYSGTIGDGTLARSLSSTADKRMFVFTASSFDKPTEIYEANARGGPGANNAAGNTASESGDDPVQLTHINDGLAAVWGKSVSVEWNNEGFHLQGWLILPKEYDAAQKYPMIVEVHGGPASAMMARWGAGGPLSAAAFSALGYFVFLPNPRGSYGQGERFTKANRKDFGYGDLRDILAGMDAVTAKYPVDAHRIGLTGWSYGGFMTMFAVTQTHRFRAAVAGAGISDWQSYYGENSIDQWMIPYFGASVYDDPQTYAKSSAIDYIKKAHTPTLLVVGDRDGECPAPQSFEFWHALRDQHVPTRFVVYPNEGHGFTNPEHQRDVLERAVEWFAAYMPAGS
jgi:dipeptidyl aminopeptidase/acylaminoacyl peptidase